MYSHTGTNNNGVVDIVVYKTFRQPLVCIGLFSLLGCGASVAQKPDQELALQLVWNTYSAQYVEADLPRLSIIWKDAPFIANGIEVAGAYWTEGPAVIWWTGSYSTSAFAHELLHAYHWLALGVEDPKHTRADWIGLVSQANQNLASNGL